MADPNQRRAAFLRECLHLSQDLRLDGNIQCCRRFIRDDQFRFMQKRNGNRHTLAHAARKFMWIGIQARCRIWNANPCEAARRQGERSTLSTAAMGLNGHSHLLTNGQHWI